MANINEFFRIYSEFKKLKSIFDKSTSHFTSMEDLNQSDINNTVNHIDQLIEDNSNKNLSEQNKNTIRKILEDRQLMQEMMELDKQLNGDYSSSKDISESTTDLFDMGQRWFPRPTGGGYPLVLDLDGDGVETISANGISRVLFNADGDGVKTATGWVNADDGLLVMDRNGNGTIILSRYTLNIL